MTWVERLDHELGALIRRDVDLGPLTTYRVGGSARRFVEIPDGPTLTTVARVLAGTGAPVLVIGKGSNLLIADGGFDGMAIRLGASFAQVRITETTVVAGGAASLPVTARRTAKAGLTGFEWAVGVPGSIGGAVRMNAGGHGSDMAASLRRVHVTDLETGEDVSMDAAALGLGYRRSSIRPGQIVVHAELELAEGDRRAAEATISEIVRWRREHQPGGQNAGSVFTNPPGDSAGRLIDTAGGRGRRFGTAEVSDKHANFIQADDGGSADDVWCLMVEIRDLVWREHGIVLRPETRTIGFPEMPDVGAQP